jgi:hypothetical protein
MGRRRRKCGGWWSKILLSEIIYRSRCVALSVGTGIRKERKVIRCSAAQFACFCDGMRLRGDERWLAKNLPKWRHKPLSLFCYHHWCCVMVIPFSTRMDTLVYSTVSYSTMQYYAVLFSTMQYYSVLCSTIQYYAVLFSTTVYSIQQFTEKNRNPQSWGGSAPRFFSDLGHSLLYRVTGLWTCDCWFQRVYPASPGKVPKRGSD